MKGSASHQGRKLEVLPGAKTLRERLDNVRRRKRACVGQAMGMTVLRRQIAAGGERQFER